MDQSVKFRPITSDLGWLTTVEEFLNAVKTGCFIDYDGYGHWATNDKVSNIQVYPSMFFQEKVFRLPEIPPWATHVLWYNK